MRQLQPNWEMETKRHTHTCAHKTRPQRSKTRCRSWMRGRGCRHLKKCGTTAIWRWGKGWRTRCRERGMQYVNIALAVSVVHASAPSRACGQLQACQKVRRWEEGKVSVGGGQAWREMVMGGGLVNKLQRLLRGCMMLFRTCALRMRRYVCVCVRVCVCVCVCAIIVVSRPRPIT